MNNNIKDTKLKHELIYYDKIIIATCLVILCSISLLPIGLIGLILSFIVFSFLNVGLAKFLINILQNKNTNYEVIFSYYKNILTILICNILKLFYIFFGFILFIIPSIICFLNFSFTPFIIAEKINISADEALKQSKKLTYRKRTEIFLYLLISLFLSLLLMCCGGIIIIGINYLFELSTYINILLYFVITTLLLTTLVLPYWNFKLAFLYIEAKQSNKNKKHTPVVNKV